MKINNTYGTATYVSYTYSGVEKRNGYKGVPKTSTLTNSTIAGGQDAYGNAYNTTITSSFQVGYQKFHETKYSEGWSITKDKSGYATSNYKTDADISTSKRDVEINENGSLTKSNATIYYTETETDTNADVSTYTKAKTSYINTTISNGSIANGTYIGTKYGGVTWLQTTKSLTIDFLRSTYTKETISESYLNNNDTSYRTTELALITHEPTTVSVIVTYNTRGRNINKIGLDVLQYQEAISTKYEAEYREYLITKSPESPQDEFDGKLTIYKEVSRKQKDYRTAETKLCEGTYSRTSEGNKETRWTDKSIRYVRTTEYGYTSTKKLTWTEWTWNLTSDLETEYKALPTSNAFVSTTKYYNTKKTTLSRVNRVAESFRHTLDKTLRLTLNDSDGDTYTEEYVQSNFVYDAIEKDDTDFILKQKSEWVTTRIHDNKVGVIETRTTSSTQRYKSDIGGSHTKETLTANTYKFAETSAMTTTIPIGTASDATIRTKIIFSRSSSSSTTVRTSSSAIENVTRTAFENGKRVTNNITITGIDWGDGSHSGSFKATGVRGTKIYNSVELTAETYSPRIVFEHPEYEEYQVTDDIYNKDKMPIVSQWKTTYLTPKFATSVDDDEAIAIEYSKECLNLPIEAEGKNIYGHNLLKTPTATLYAYNQTIEDSTYETSSRQWTDTYEVIYTKQSTSTQSSPSLYPKIPKNEIFLTYTSSTESTTTITQRGNRTDTVSSVRLKTFCGTIPYYTSTVDEMFVSMSLFGKNELSEYSDYDTSIKFPDVFTRNTLDNSEIGTYSTLYSTVSMTMRTLDEMEEFVHQLRVYDETIVAKSFSRTNYKYSVALTTTQEINTERSGNTYIEGNANRLHGTTVMGGWNYDGKKLTGSIINRNLGYITIQTAMLHYSDKGADQWNDLILKESDTENFAFDGSNCTQVRQKPLITSAESANATNFEQSVTIGARKFPDPYRPRYFSYTDTDILQYVPKETSDKYFNEFWETGMYAHTMVYYPYTSKADGAEDTIFTFFNPRDYLELQKKLNGVDVF